MHSSNDIVLGIAPLSHPSQYLPSPFCRQLGVEQVQWPVMMLFMLLFLYIIWNWVFWKFTTTPLPCTWSGGLVARRWKFCSALAHFSTSCGLWTQSVTYPPHPIPQDTLEWLTLLPIWIPYTTCSVTMTEVCWGWGGGGRRSNVLDFVM